MIGLVKKSNNEALRFLLELARREYKPRL